VYQGLEHERRCIDARECVDQQHQPIVHLIAVGHVYTLCHYILKGNSIKDVGENKYTASTSAKGTTKHKRRKKKKKREKEKGRNNALQGSPS
jgi:hypothetical protein